MMSTIEHILLKLYNLLILVYLIFCKYKKKISVQRDKEKNQGEIHITKRFPRKVRFFNILFSHHVLQYFRVSSESSAILGPNLQELPLINTSMSVLYQNSRIPFKRTICYKTGLSDSIRKEIKDFCLSHTQHGQQIWYKIL